MEYSKIEEIEIRLQSLYDYLGLELMERKDAGDWDEHGYRLPMRAKFIVIKKMSNRVEE
jgi:hypothetical protein